MFEDERDISTEREAAVFTREVGADYESVYFTRDGFRNYSRSNLSGLHHVSVKFTFWEPDNLLSAAQYVFALGCGGANLSINRKAAVHFNYIQNVQAAFDWPDKISSVCQNAFIRWTSRNDGQHFVECHPKLERFSWRLP